MLWLIAFGDKKISDSQDEQLAVDNSRPFIKYKFDKFLVIKVLKYTISKRRLQNQLCSIRQWIRSQQSFDIPHQKSEASTRLQYWTTGFSNHDNIKIVSMTLKLPLQCQYLICSHDKRNLVQAWIISLIKSQFPNEEWFSWVCISEENLLLFQSISSLVNINGTINEVFYFNRLL